MASNNSTNATDSYSPKTLQVDDRLSNIIVYCVVFPAIIIIGLFGNILTINILRKQKLKSPSMYMQITLAFADLFYLIARAIYGLFRCGHLFYPELMYHVTLYVSSFFVNVFSQIFGRLSKFLLIPICIDRILVVWMPFKFRNIMTRRVGFIIITTICTTTILINLVEPIEILVVEQMSGQVVSGTSAIEELHRHNIHTSKEMYIYRTFTRIVFDFLPIVAVFTCNIFIIMGFRNSNAPMKDINSDVFRTRREQEKRMTVTLVTISFAYLLLCLPLDVMILALYFNLVDLPPKIISTVPKFTQIPAILNHAINFVIYGLTNQNYRYECKQIMCCKREKSESKRIRYVSSVAVSETETSRL